VSKRLRVFQVATGNVGTDIDNVTCIESVDVSCHHSAETWANCGFGRPVDDPEVPRHLELGTRVFEDGVRLMADCLDIELDEVVFQYELGACTKDVDLGWYQLPAGSLGSCAFQYVGKVDGTPRVELHLEWQMTPHTDPHWNIQGCYITKIQGDPCIYSKHMISPQAGGTPSQLIPTFPRPKPSRRSA
jgi:4-hydroxy-tetrahydrodipicolinate reductase